jgi:putative endonuclease
MSFVVCILFSERIEKYYIGQTNDLANRLAEHNLGETSSIRNGIPWSLAWSQLCDSRSEAVRIEAKIKKRGAKRFLDDLSRGA